MEPLTSQQSHNKPIFEIGKLHENVPFQTYADSDGINSHGLMDILRSPAHYYEHKFNRVEEKDTDALRFGRLFHYAVLEPHLFRERAIIEPVFQGRTKAGQLTTSKNATEVKQKRDEWFQALPEGAIVVPNEWLDQLTGMANKIMTHKLTKNLLREGVRETTLYWHDDETGELCKSRPDFISSQGHIVDLKTSMDARENYFARDILKHSYHIQSSHYLNGARITNTARSDSFIFLVIEKTPPFEIAVYPCGASVLGVGDQWRSKAMRIYSRCRKTNKWPGYNHEAKVIELPPWAEAVDPDEVQD
jgi:hypothetical protein